MLWILLFLLTGCAEKSVKKAVGPPTSTQESCQQVRDFFTDHGVKAPTQPTDMHEGCHLRITAKSGLESRLKELLQERGWKRDPTYGEGTSLTSAWDVISTRCVVTEIPEGGGSSVHPSGSIGIGGGSGGFFSGIGIGIGGTPHVSSDYKVDCLPKP